MDIKQQLLSLPEYDYPANLVMEPQCDIDIGINDLKKLVRYTDRLEIAVSMAIDAMSRQDSLCDGSYEYALDTLKMTLKEAHVWIGRRT